MKFVDFTLQDIPHCLEIFRSNIPKFFREYEIPGYQSYLEEHALKNYWLLEDRGQWVGCGGIAVDASGEARLCFGIIRGELHKNGYGRALIEFRLREIAKRPEAKRVGLDTSQHNPEFFKKFGFHTVETKLGHYAPDLDSYEMICDITPERREQWLKIGEKWK